MTPSPQQSEIFSFVQRLGLVLTFPIWFPLVLALGVIAIIYTTILMFPGGLVYWICTGKDIMKTKANIFNT